MEQVKIGRYSSVVKFATDDGIILGGILFKNAIKPRTCMIFVHGMSGSVLSGVSLAIAKSLDNYGALFSFNNRGCGLVSSFSKYARGKKRRFVAGTNLERFEDCIYDIKGAIDAMSKLGYAEFVLIGHSTGCQKAAYYQYAAIDRRIAGIVLVAPCDDYNLNKERLGRSYKKIKETCLGMIKSGRGGDAAPGAFGLSAQRLDSLINERRVEARMFDYDGRLKEFGAIKTPILAIFGSDEENTIEPVGMCLGILESRTSSDRFEKCLIPGANHAFEGKEKALASSIKKWINGL
ncbi:MAG: alpha/beta fold hydrolase [Candidatus Micrarchaeaceae archaeon]